MTTAQPKRFLVLGGGISGLSTAWYLKRNFPTSHIHLIESSSRLGGWMRTVQHQGQLFETGPRTLRPNDFQGATTLGMIHDLGLKDQLIIVPKDHVAAKNRYLLSENRIHRLPSSLHELVFNPPLFMKGFTWRILKELFIKPSTLEDETVYDFISRRFGKETAEYLVSAMIHGIYAGDCTKLSMKSTLKGVWRAEKESGSVVRGMLAPPSRRKNRSIKEITQDKETTQFIYKIMKESSVYSFKNGMETLTRELAKDLTNSPQVTLHLNSTAKKIEFTTEDHTLEQGTQMKEKRSLVTMIKIEDTSNNHQERNAIETDHVFCCLPANKASHLEGLPSEIQQVLSHVEFGDVVVVNLAYDLPNRDTFPYPGFGYLVPMTEESDILGVVFDSFTLASQDTDGLTRFTVMMKPFKKVDSSGSKEVEVKEDKNDYMYLTKAKEEMETHLGVHSSNLKLSLVHQQWSCIPQYTLGHSERVNQLKEFSEKYPISFSGSSYHGVGINDVVLDARDSVMRLLA